MGTRARLCALTWRSPPLALLRLTRLSGLLSLLVAAGIPLPAGGAIRACAFAAERMDRRLLHRTFCIRRGRRSLPALPPDGRECARAMPRGCFAGAGLRPALPL